MMDTIGTGACQIPMRADIGPEDALIQELTDILFDVQRRLCRTFDLMDVFNILRYTIRKCELNGKGEDYIPILFENELRDFVMREEINALGRMNLCARSAT